MNYVIVGMAAKKLKETRVLLWLPFLEIGLILFQMTIFMANAIFKTHPLEVTQQMVKDHIQKAKEGNQMSFHFLLDHFGGMFTSTN